MNEKQIFTKYFLYQIRGKLIFFMTILYMFLFSSTEVRFDIVFISQLYAFRQSIELLEISYQNMFTFSLEYDTL